MNKTRRSSWKLSLFLVLVLLLMSVVCTVSYADDTAATADATPTEGYVLTIYNADGTEGMRVDGTKSASAFSLRTALEDARVFVDNAFLFGIQTPATYVVEMYEDSTEDQSFEIGADVTVNGNGHKIVLAEGVVLTNNGTLNNVVLNDYVAEVAGVKYATIDEAIANWTNGTTLKLLKDVTLSDVIKLKSTEHHILDLGTYTMTAASGQHAIEITCEGRSSASYALTVNADANNPGGITATGKSCIYYKKSGSTKDRPIILINNGVFTGSYSLNLSSNGNTNCPQIWINGGIFNSYMNLTKCMLRVSGGTFHGAINCTGDSSAYRQFTGGRFKSWQFMTADAPTKFWVGSGNGNYNVGVYVDAEGYLVVGGPVITEVSEKYPAVASNATKWSSYLKYSSAATYGLFYEDPAMAIAKHGEANVTLWEKPAVTIPDDVLGDEVVVEEIKNNTALKEYEPELPENVEELVIELKSVEDKIVYDVSPVASGEKVEPDAPITFRLPIPASVTDAYAKVYHEGDFMGIYPILGEGNAKYIELSSQDFSEYAVEPTKAAKAAIGDQLYDTFADALAAAKAGDTITLLADLVLEADIAITKSVTIDGNGHAVIPADESKTYNSAFMVGDSGWGDDHGETITLKNLKFDGWTVNYGVVRVQGVTLIMDGCEFSGNTVLNATYAVLSLNAADATVTNTKFLNNNSRVIDANYNVDSTNAVITIDGCTIEGNTTTGAGIVFRNAGTIAVKNTKFVNNTVNTTGNGATVYVGFGTGNEVSGCYFEGNTVTTTHTTTKRFASAIFCDGCDVNGNVFGADNTATRADVAIATVVAVGAYYGPANISGNYWVDGSLPVKGDVYTVEYTRQTVTLDTYCSEVTVDENGNAVVGATKEVPKPSGSVAYRGYINDSDSREAIQIDLSGVYAANSFVVKLYDANGNLLTTTTFRNGGITAESLTCNIVLWGTESGSWATEIHTELTVANVPALAEIYADGVLVESYQHESGSILADKLDNYKALDCVYKAAKIGDMAFVSVADALAYAKNAGLTNVEIILVGETTADSADIFDLTYVQLFDSVTFKQADASKPYYIACIYTGSRTNGGVFTFDGVNIVVTDQYMFEGNVKLSGNSVIKSVAEANCFIYSGTTTVEPGSKLYGVIDDLRAGDLIIDGGRTDGQYNAEPDMQDAILVIRWAGDSVTVQNGAYVKVNAVNEIGRASVLAGTSLNVYGSKFEAWEYIENNGVINLDANALITTGKLYGAGSIVIDVTGFTGRKTVISSKDLSGFTGTITLTGNDDVKYAITENGLEIYYVAVAQIGDVKYGSLAAAAEAAVAGDMITLLEDIVLSADVTLPAGITLNGNGKSISGATVWAAGDLTFVGYTKISTFNAGYNQPTITISAGACLETTSGRMVIGHGATFNIIGNIVDAKTADKADLTPSLIAPGASFTGAGVTFNVTNAYVKFTAYCSSKNSSANGTFTFNVTNSIWEQSGSLVFSEPTNGKDPTVNFYLTDSVLTSTSHLVFAVSKGEIVFDNSNVNVGANRQLENRSTLTIKNGSVVYAALATSSNAKNPGKTIVDGATYITTGEFSGADVGIGTLIVQNGATVTVGNVSKANVTVDVTSVLTVNNFLSDTTVTIDATAFDGNKVLVIKSANIANYTAISVLGNAAAAFACDGEGVSVIKMVAQIGDVKYETLADALAAAVAGDTIWILGDITEDITELLDVTFATNVAGGVTITNSYDVDWIKVVNFTLGSGVTLRMDNAYFTNAGVNVIEGTLIIDTTLYNANNAKLTIQNGGAIATGGMIVNRYHTDGTAGIYVYGDGDDSTVEISSADTIGTYSGTFYAKDAVVNGNMFWIDYKKGSTEEADKYSVSNVHFVDSTLNVTSEFRLYKDASLTLEGSSVTAGKVQIRENATPVVSATNSTVSASTVENLTGASINAVLNSDGTVSFKPILIPIEYTNVGLTDSFKISFAFPVASFADLNGYYVVITKTSANDGSEETLVIPADAWFKTAIEGVDHYVVDYAGVAAKEMMDVLSVVICDADGNVVSAPKTDSIQDYAMRKLSRSTDATLNTLLVDMLNYGAQAQIFFGYATDKLANADLTDEQKAFASDAREYSDAMYSKTYADGYDFTIANTLILENNIQLKAGFDLRSLDLSEDAKIVMTYVNVKGITVTTELSLKDYDYKNEVTLITCDGLTARDADVQITVELVDGENVIATFTNSVEGFVARLSETSEKADVCTALMKYCDSAKAYFAN